MIEKLDFNYQEDKTNINEIENRELNVNDSKVKDRWSRYIGAMGIDAVRKQACAKVMLVNVGALGVEIAKNIM